MVPATVAATFARALGAAHLLRVLAPLPGRLLLLLLLLRGGGLRGWGRRPAAVAAVRAATLQRLPAPLPRSLLPRPGHRPTAAAL